MRLSHLLCAALLLPLPFSACVCGDDLDRLPEPEAILAYEDTETPPEDHLVVGIGAVDIGQQATRTLTLRNDGDGAYAYSELLLGADGELCLGSSTAWRISSDTPVEGEIAAGASIDIDVVFTPTDGLPGCAVLSVVTDDEGAPLLKALFTGQGDAAALCADEPAVDFGEVVIGDVAEDTLEVRSCGTRAIEITALLPLSSFPPFGVDTTVVPAMLEPGDVLTVPVSFAPTVPGPYRLTSNTAGIIQVETSRTDQLYQLLVEGDAVEPPRCALDLVPTIVQFGTVYEGQMTTQSVIVRNLGDLDCNITNVDLGAGTDGAFTVVTHDVPATLAPGAFGTVELAFAPDAPGTFYGSLVVDSDDLLSPQQQADLEGTALMTQPCMLQATPNPLAFGFAPLGQSTVQQLTLESVGTENCTVTTVDITTQTGQGFSVSGWSGLAVMPPGDTRTVDVTFFPVDTTSQSGQIGIWLGFPVGPPDLTVPLSGAGSGPALCIDPAPVAFGSHPVGAAIDKVVTLANCGSQDLSLTSVTLSSDTPPEFTVEDPAPLVTLVPGDSVTTTLRFVSATEGTYEGHLLAESDDPIAPDQDVLLVASASDDGCGDITGVVCGLDGASPAPGATVTVQAGGETFTTTATAGGEFVLSCVPPGTHTVVAESGNWSTSFNANVVAYQTTVVDEPQCLDPGSARVAVVTGEWDAIESILDDMGIDHDVYTGYAEDFGQTEIGDLIDDLGNYDIVFLSCGMDESEFGASEIAALSAFLDGGGSLYASDWAYDILERVRPEAFDFFGDDNAPGAAESAGSFSGTGFVLDAGLMQALGGRSEIPIESCCTAIEAVGMGSSTYLEGDRLDDGLMRPLLVGHSAGADAGRMFYSDFHSFEQEDIDQIFTWVLQQL